MGVTKAEKDEERERESVSEAKAVGTLDFARVCVDGGRRDDDAGLGDGKTRGRRRR